MVGVNYGGSTGYGRAYRQRLNGQWGVVDVADCVSAADHLVARGHADADRLIVRGNSAGGYTTLAALVFRPDVFKAGASYYGISDLEAMTRDTHKFESRYLDRLVGPYPAGREVYRERSPIHFVDRLACPLILFQGLEDQVVPPNQAQMMADAVRVEGTARRPARLCRGAARIPQGGDRRPLSGSRAVFLRSGVRFHSGGRGGSGGHRQQKLGIGN